MGWRGGLRSMLFARIRCDAPSPYRSSHSSLTNARRIDINSFLHLPRKGGNLELGNVEDCGGKAATVKCPRHGWCFELDNGYCEVSTLLAGLCIEEFVLPPSLSCLL